VTWTRRHRRSTSGAWLLCYTSDASASDANSQIAGISAANAKGGAPITERNDENAG
jgi:hypothetical protein